jgi:ATP-binding cassette subfamily B protein
MESLKRITPYLKPYWKEITYSMISLSLVVLTWLFIPMQIERVIDQGIEPGDAQVVITSTVIMIVLTLLSMLMAIINTVYSVRIAENFAADVRSSAYRKIQTFSFANLDHLQTGQLLVRLTSDINIIKMALLMTLRMLLRAPLMLVGALIMLIITSPRLALLLAVLLPVTVGLIFFYSKRTEPMYKAVQAKLDRVNTILQENIAGVRVVRAFVREAYEKTRFKDSNQELMERSIEVNQLVALLLPTMMLVINLGMTAIIWLGGYMSIGGGISTGEIVAFTNYLMMTMFPVIMLGMILPQLYASAASVDRIMEIMDTQATIQNKAGAKEIDPSQFTGRIAFENVSLNYDGAGGEHTPVLQNISFTAEPGQMIAILGATGSGKSSLVHLIPRFYDPTEGRITLDGVDILDLTKESLREQIGVSLQEAVLFSGSIRDNIKYGQPEAPDSQMIDIAKASQAHDFIMEKPEGYDNQVGQRGGNLSGGQKQRIAIARAINSDPSILILDDSTSAVDVDTEAKLQQALSERMRGKTIIVVAQRISTVLNADNIIVLDNGRIAAMGTHLELMESSPIYQEIYYSQLGNSGSSNSNASQVLHA